MEKIVVGAGLAGLVCAINLAREGEEVLVIERESRIGGSPVYHPSPQGTPLDLRAIEAFTGIDLSPAVKRFTTGRGVIDGEIVPVDMDMISAYMVERGPREASLDSYLYRIALDCGVKFEFNRGVITIEDFLGLPPDTVVATGLHFEGFDSFRVPYLTSFHYLARKRIEDKESTHVSVYHGEFTKDYAYTSSINGVLLAHLFQRTPIGRDSLERFKEQIFVTEGLEFEHWEHFTFPVPAATMNNPRIFAGRIILAGTLAGFMEAYMFFGIHGALVSGKIAALAVRDRSRAFELFRKAISPFKHAYILKKATLLMPHALRSAALKRGLGTLNGSAAVAGVVKRGMPGWKNCQEALPEAKVL